MLNSSAAKIIQGLSHEDTSVIIRESSKTKPDFIQVLRIVHGWLWSKETKVKKENYLNAVTKYYNLKRDMPNMPNTKKILFSNALEEFKEYQSHIKQGI